MNWCSGIKAGRFLVVFFGVLKISFEEKYPAEIIMCVRGFWILRETFLELFNGLIRLVVAGEKHRVVIMNAS